jgi:hypothetical protein
MRRHRKEGVEVETGKTAVDLLFERGAEVLEQGFVRAIMACEEKVEVGEGSEEEDVSGEDEESEEEKAELKRITDLSDSEDEEYVPRVRKAKVKAVREMGRKKRGQEEESDDQNGDERDQNGTESEDESVKEWKSVARSKAMVRSERSMKKDRTESRGNEVDGDDEQEKEDDDGVVHGFEHDSDKDADGEEEDEHDGGGHESTSSASDTNIVGKQCQHISTQKADLTRPRLSETTATHQAPHSVRTSNAFSEDMDADGEEDDEYVTNSASSPSNSVVLYQHQQPTANPKGSFSTPPSPEESQQVIRHVRTSIASTSSSSSDIVVVTNGLPSSSSTSINDSNKRTQKREPSPPRSSDQESLRASAQKRRSNAASLFFADDEGDDSDCIVVEHREKRQKLNHASPQSRGSGSRSETRGASTDAEEDVGRPSVSIPVSCSSKRKMPTSAVIEVDSGSGRAEFDQGQSSQEPTSPKPISGQTLPFPVPHKQQIQQLNTRPGVKPIDIPKSAVLPPETPEVTVMDTKPPEQDSCTQCSGQQRKLRSESEEKMRVAFEKLNERIQEAVVGLWEEIL